jgi:hypothetical protein
MCKAESVHFHHDPQNPLFPGDGGCSGARSYDADPRRSFARRKVQHHQGHQAFAVSARLLPPFCNSQFVTPLSEPNKFCRVAATRAGSAPTQDSACSLPHHVESIPTKMIVNCSDEGEHDGVPRPKAGLSSSLLAPDRTERA